MTVSEGAQHSDSAAELFGDHLAVAEAYADLLATTGVERGLIGPREVPRIWDRHLLNCVVLGELIPSGVELADVGSGAGLPGVPLAIARPDLSVFLIEPLLRRVLWLREIVLELELANVEIIRARANAVAETARVFDVVTARAVAPLPALAEWCVPLVRPGGELLAMKGESAGDELLDAELTLEGLGATAWSVASCGEGVLEMPTRVVRVVAGVRRGSQSAGARKKPARAKRSANARPVRATSTDGAGGGSGTGERRPRRG
jgi:16S rRNA (guanine527-N7)-methyltransferase